MLFHVSQLIFVASICSLASAELYSLVAKPICNEIVIGGFTHPGIIHSCEDLTRMQTMVWAKKDPWTTAFGRMFNESLVGLAIPSSNQYNIRGPLPALPYGQDGWSSNFTVDAQYAYLNAVAYFVTGHPFHRERVLHTARRWLTTLSLLEEYIRGGAGLRYLTAACEIFRFSTTTQWTTNDTALYTNFAKRVRANWDNTNGMARTDLFMNQGAYANGGALAMAVFLGDVALYKQIIYQATIGANPDPTIDYAIGKEIHNDTAYYGQVGEMGRDQSHPAGWMKILGEMAYTAEIQGNLGGQTTYVNLFTWDNFRLLAGMEYWARFQLGHTVPWKSIPNGFDTGAYYSAVANATDRGLLYRTQMHPTDIGSLNMPTGAYYRFQELAPDKIKYLPAWMEGQTVGIDTLTFARAGNYEGLNFSHDNGYGGSYYDVISGSAYKRQSLVNETEQGRNPNTTWNDIAVMTGNSTITFPAFWGTVTKPFIRLEARALRGANLTVTNQTNGLMANYYVPASSTFSTVYLNTTLDANPGTQYWYLMTNNDVEVARFNMMEATAMMDPFEDSPP